MAIIAAIWQSNIGIILVQHQKTVANPKEGALSVSEQSLPDLSLSIEVKWHSLWTPKADTVERDIKQMEP